MRENKGITLVALVVTIIVLLILAGVSIAMLTDENGILKQANAAKQTNIEGEVKETANLAFMAAQTAARAKIASATTAENAPSKVTGKELKSWFVSGGLNEDNYTVVVSTSKPSQSNGTTGVVTTLPTHVDAAVEEGKTVYITVVFKSGGTLESQYRQATNYASAAFTSIYSYNGSTGMLKVESNDNFSSKAPAAQGN